MLGCLLGFSRRIRRRRTSWDAHGRQDRGSDTTAVHGESAGMRERWTNEWFRRATVARSSGGSTRNRRHHSSIHHRPPAGSLPHLPPVPTCLAGGRDARNASWRLCARPRNRALPRPLRTATTTVGGAELQARHARHGVYRRDADTVDERFANGGRHDSSSCASDRRYNF